MTSRLLGRACDSADRRVALAAECFAELVEVYWDSSILTASAIVNEYRIRYVRARDRAMRLSEEYRRREAKERGIKELVTR